MAAAPLTFSSAAANAAATRTRVDLGLRFTDAPGSPLLVASTGPGQSTLQLSMPNGYRIPPHFHPSYEHVAVKEGTLLVGMGDRLDPKRTQALAAGDSATAPAGMHHFSIAKGRTVLSVTFMGPYTITYLRAEDAPRPPSFPFGY